MSDCIAGLRTRFQAGIRKGDAGLAMNEAPDASLRPLQAVLRNPDRSTQLLPHF